MQERAQSVVNCLNTFKSRTAAPLKQFQRLLGHMVAAAAVMPLGLLRMRFQPAAKPSPRGRSAPGTGLQACCDLHGCLRQGLGAHVQRLAVSGVWTGPQLHWHINCLELLAVHLALNCLKRRLRGEHVLVHTDNTAVYIKQQGGLRSNPMSLLARYLLLWSQNHLRSRRAIHIPGLLNRAANELCSPESRDSIPRRSS